MNQVYLIKSEDTGYFKIGVSKHPNKRIKELQTGNSSVLSIVTTYSSDNAYKIEKTLHRRYSYLRKDGEWFDFTDILNEIEEEFNTNSKQLDENFKFLVKNGNNFI
jgi:translation elongation factor P/translation initiation factor 5A